MTENTTHADIPRLKVNEGVQEWRALDISVFCLIGNEPKNGTKPPCRGALTINTGGCQGCSWELWLKGQGLTFRPWALAAWCRAQIKEEVKKDGEHFPPLPG